MNIQMDKSVAIALIFMCAAVGLGQLKPYLDSAASYFTGSAVSGKKR